MRIKDIIGILGITRETLRGWELGLYEPHVQYIPIITSFLGYPPFNFDSETLCGGIKKYRFDNGLTQEQFGKLFNTDKCTVSFWETNRRLPLPKTAKAIMKLIT